MVDWLKKHRIALLILGVCSLLFWVGLQFAFPRFLSTYIASESFRQMLSRLVSQSIKVEGEFAPFRPEGWTVRTDSFESHGRPGEAIYELKAYHSEGTFDPWAMFRRVWEVDSLHAQTGSFVLGWPDDAKKIPILKKPRPWYAFLMPDRFFCRKIVCDQAEVKFNLGAKSARLTNARVEAKMIGKDFMYHSQSGDFDFDLLPPMKLENLSVFVDRYKAELYNVQLSQGSAGPGKMVVSGRLGMRDDKSLGADVEVQDLDFSRVLPHSVQGSLTGLVSGKIRWDTDVTGKNNASSGQISLHRVRLAQWAFMADLRRFLDRPGLEELSIDQANCQYVVEHEVFETKNLHLETPYINVQGLVRYDWGGNSAALDLQIAQWNLATLAPTNLHVQMSEPARATLQWQGPLDKPLEASGAALIEVRGATFTPPPSLQSLLTEYQLTAPTVISLSQLRLPVTYRPGYFDLHDFVVEMPGILKLQGTASYDNAGVLALAGGFSGMEIEPWLVAPWKGRIKGQLDGQGNWKCQDWAWDKGQGQAALHFQHGELQGLPWQQWAARFCRDDSWLRLRWSICELTVHADARGWNVENVHFLAPQKMGVQGAMQVTRTGQLQGTIRLGLSAPSLAWLPEANRVFNAQQDGLCWATIQVGGTTKHPVNDLVPRVKSLLFSHPWALAGLALRGASWWLGDALQTYRPN